jgi:predicted O-methyltransferase YrrM
MSNLRATNIRTARQSLFALGPVRLRDEGYGPDDFARVSVPETDCDVLRDQLLAEQPATVIEIWLAYGASSLAIAEALVEVGREQARHLIVDAHQARAFHSSGWNALVNAGLTDVCTLVQERSQIALPRLWSEGFVADAAFVDGSHSFHNVFLDLYYLRELVRPGGLLILDDCQYPSVTTAVRYFELNTGWHPEPIAARTRLRAYRLPDPPIEPRFEDFRPFGLGAEG